MTQKSQLDCRAADGGATGHRLAPLIETTFRAAHILVTKMRAGMLDEGREDELDELIEGAREYQDRLLEREPGERSGGVHEFADPGPAGAQ